MGAHDLKSLVEIAASPEADPEIVAWGWHQHWVIIVDEAQDFRPDVLGILRILTNFDMDSRLVVSLLLAGQTPLR